MVIISYFNFFEKSCYYHYNSRQNISTIFFQKIELLIRKYDCSLFISTILSSIVSMYKLARTITKNKNIRYYCGGPCYFHGENPTLRSIVKENKDLKLTLNQNTDDIKKILENIEILKKNVPMGYSKYCNYCGNIHDSDKWPKVCKCCNNTIYRNPIHVAVGLLPFVSNTQVNGLLLVQRATKPFIGEYCLPGGIVDWGESWKEVASREMWRKTFIKTDPDEFEFTKMILTPDKTKQLLFLTSRKVRNEKDFALFTPNSEVSNIFIANKGTQLCFPSHQEIFDNYFKE